MRQKSSLGRWSMVGVLLVSAAVSCGDDPSAESVDEGAAPSPVAGPWADRRDIRFEPREIARSASTIEFGDVVDLAVDTRGRIYAGDGMALQISVLSSTGDRIRTIGGEGQGPGEFHSVTNLQVLPGDSLLVYDVRLQRITVFRPHSSEPAYTLQIETRPRAAFPEWIEKTTSGDFLAAFERPFTPTDDLESDTARTNVLKLLNSEGAVERDSILVFPESRPFTVRRPGGGILISTNPFAREGTVTLFGDSVYYGYNDSLHFEVRTLEGRRLSGFAYPYDNAPVAPAEIDSVAAGKEFESIRSAVRSQAPDTWPAWDSYLVAGDGSLLVGLRTELGQPAEWARFGPDGRYLGSFTLPPAVKIYDTAGDTLYAVHRNPLDVPRIRVYELERLGSPSR